MIRKATLVGFGLVAAVMAALQLAGPSAYYSDYASHIKVAQTLAEGTIQAPHFAFHALVVTFAHLVGYFTATVVLISLLQTALAYVVFRYFKTTILSRNEKQVLWLTVAMLFVAPINIFTAPNLFLGYITSTTHHNPTILAVKPFALISVLMTIHFLHNLDNNKVQWKYLANYVVVILVMCFIKPSFTIVLGPSLLIYWIIQKKGAKHRRYLIALVVFFLGSLPILTWQYIFMFGREASGGIAFSPFSVAAYFEPVLSLFILKCLLSILFPLWATLCLFRKRSISSATTLSWICFTVSLAFYLLLAETGARSSHGNFGWGLSLSLFVLFVTTTANFYSKKIPSLQVKVGNIFLGLHFICGIIWYLASANAFGSLCADGWGNWCW